MANKRDNKKVTNSNKSLSKKPLHSSSEVDKKIKPNADKPLVKSGSKRKATDEGMVPDIKKKFADDVVEPNVDGKLITTLSSTLAEELKNKQAGILSKPEDIVNDKDGRCFINCDVFVDILDFLRSGTLPRQERVLEVYDLATKYRIQPLVEKLGKYFVVQYRNKIAKLKENMTKSENTWCEEMKQSLINDIRDNGYCSPKEDISIYDTNTFCRCIYCPLRPARVFFKTSYQYSDAMRTLVMYELCELGYAKKIDTKKINIQCNTCCAWHEGVEIVLVAH